MVLINLTQHCGKKVVEVVLPKTKQYYFHDNDKRIIKNEIVYYRLKHVDVNGNYTYSAIKEVRMNNKDIEEASAKVIPAHRKANQITLQRLCKIRILFLQKN